MEVFLNMGNVKEIREEVQEAEKPEGYLIVVFLILVYFMIILEIAIY